MVMLHNRLILSVLIETYWNIKITVLARATFFCESINRNTLECKGCWHCCERCFSGSVLYRNIMECKNKIRRQSKGTMTYGLSALSLSTFSFSSPYLSEVIFLFLSQISWYTYCIRKNKQYYGNHKTYQDIYRNSFR